MQFQDNPFASLQQSQFGQMAGPGGFAGGGAGFGQMLPQIGGGMFGAPPEKKKHPSLPWMMGGMGGLGLLGGLLGGGAENMAMLGAPLGYGLYKLLK